MLALLARTPAFGAIRREKMPADGRNRIDHVLIAFLEDDHADRVHVNEPGQRSVDENLSLFTRRNIHRNIVAFRIHDFPGRTKTLKLVALKGFRDIAGADAHVGKLPRVLSASGKVIV